jgi:hypothetical protein
MRLIQVLRPFFQHDIMLKQSDSRREGKNHIAQ